MGLVQSETAGKGLAQARVGGLRVLHHRCVGLEQNVDGRDRACLWVQCLIHDPLLIERIPRRSRRLLSAHRPAVEVMPETGQFDLARRLPTSVN